MTAADDRLAKRRLVGILLLSPVLLVPAAALLAGPRVGVPVASALCLLLPALAWIGALAVAGARSVRPGEIAVLGAGALLCAAMILLAGGPASPMLILAAALPVEGAWVARSRNAVLSGVAAAAGALAAAVLAGFAWPQAAGTVSVLHWSIPALYALTLAARFPRFGRRGEERQGGDGSAVRCAGMALTMAPGGDVLEAADGIHAPLGFSSALLLGQGLFDRIHVGDRVAFLRALDALRAGERYGRAEVRLRLPDDVVLGADSFRPFVLEAFGADGGPIAAQLHDNSEVVALRTALARAEERTESIDIAKGRFLAAVSHELRTPLNAIIGFSDILLHEMFGGFTDARQREYSQLIKDAGHHLLSVVNAILDVSKIEAGSYPIQPESFAFADAVEMCNAMMALQAQKKGVDLRVQIPRTVGEVVADRRAVQQILINLVANAIKFTPESGSVVIGARRLGSRLHFWVADTGIGIAAEDLDRIGRPFTQVRNDYTRQFEGTGLGLSLVKGLVALHGGTMSIESAPGEGTKVAISLPVDGVATSETGNAPAEETHGTLRKTA